MRLDRFLANHAGVSRKRATRVLRAGRVEVNGLVVRDGAFDCADGVEVRLDGESVVAQGPRYLMLHKPLGYECSGAPQHYPSVLALVPQLPKRPLHVAGRLDVETSGLVLLTDDGAWSHRVTSPRAGLPKRYRVGLAEPLGAEDARRLAQGVQLRGERRPSAPAELLRLTDTEVEITVREGRYHLVRRLFGALGNRVLTLHRQAIGELVLDDGLQPGEWRVLEQSELGLFQA